MLTGLPMHDETVVETVIPNTQAACTEDTHVRSPQCSGKPKAKGQDVSGRKGLAASMFALQIEEAAVERNLLKGKNYPALIIDI